ncbi:MAG: CopG family transcriptional regulator [Thiothrix sp.]|nr:MAG: CopG family transcriptional regulator [Thiothrix sp.]
MDDNYDFSQAQRGAIAKINKEKITIRLDPEVLAWFRDQVAGGGNYQALINEALKEHIKLQGESLDDRIRRIFREEMQAAQKVA